MAHRGRTLFWLGIGAGALVAARSMARQKRRYNFSGKTVLITGGSRGLGLELARLFAKENANLVLVARDGNELEQAHGQLRGTRIPLYTTACDITDRDQIEAMVARVRERYGKIDVLVNNAGVIEVGPLETMTLEDFREAMQTHYWGPLYTILTMLPEMQARREGRIVNIASIGGKISVPHLLPYSASKHALVGLSEGLRSELLKDNVYVTTVCPGLMRTGSHVNATFKGQNRLEYTLFSIIDSLPFTSSDAASAARQIVEACRYGDAELVIGLPAQAAALVHAVLPGATADLLGVGNRLLPGPGGIGKERATGKESHTPLAPSLLTALADRAVNRNNEF